MKEVEIGTYLYDPKTYLHKIIMSLLRHQKRENTREIYLIFQTKPLSHR